MMSWLRKGSSGASFSDSAVLSAVITVGKEDVDAELRPVPALRKRLESLFDSPFDILVLSSEYDPEKGYYPTTDAIPAVHRFLVDQKIRHRFSILVSGGLRSAADTQKTIQRGANGVKIDWPVLLTVDPMARQKYLKKEKLESSLDVPLMAKRIANLIRVWNIQITEVLGASGFKDIKKTVGEENRLLIFDDLEERIYDIFKSPERLERNRQSNQRRMEREGEGNGWRYSQLKALTQPVSSPHQFYRCNLKASCYKIFDRDHVWPGSLLASAGRMASGDPKTFLLSQAEERGNLGDGFDDITILFKDDPDSLSEERLDRGLHRPPDCTPVEIEDPLYRSRYVCRIDRPRNLARPGPCHEDPRYPARHGGRRIPHLLYSRREMEPSRPFGSAGRSFSASSWRNESSSPSKRSSKGSTRNWMNPLNMRRSSRP